jgi:hypothetical protein
MRHWIIALVAIIAAAVGGGVTSPRADEFTRIEVGVGDLRGEILSLFAPPGAIATETNAITRPLRPPRLRLLLRRPPRTGRATTRR